MKPVLLLNASDEVITVINWRKAVQLLFSGKAEKPHGHEEYHEIPTVEGVYFLPTAIVLARYVKIPYKSARLTRGNIAKRDNNTCQYCSKVLKPSEQTIDHVIPKSKGGDHKWNNVALACIRCNMDKADRTPEQAGMKLLKSPKIPTKSVLVFDIYNKSSLPGWEKWL